jgi:hypothetical protein
LGNETLYRIALTNLSSNPSGSVIFEKICHIVVKFMYPTFGFKLPEGGQGTKDGGYDGYDPVLKAKLACSLDKNYERKIETEVIKSKANGDLHLFYLSNQVIPQTENNRIKQNHDHTDINLIISGIDELSNAIDDYRKNHYDQELYDLLNLHNLQVGEYYERGDARPYNISYNGKIYNKKVVIIEKDNYGYFNSQAETKINQNPLLDLVISRCSDMTVDSFKNIALCGIGYLGKSFLMKWAYNTLIDKFSDKDNYSKYKYIPFVQFYELKYYNNGSLGKLIKNYIDPLLIFLDGLDELSESNKVFLNKEIQSILHLNNRIRFIISGRNASFFDLDVLYNSTQLYLEKYYDTNDIELLELLEEYKNTPIYDLLPIPTYRNFVLEKKISNKSKLEEFYYLLVRDSLENDKERRDSLVNISSRMNSDIDINKIINKISHFCFDLIINGKRIFKENEIKELFNKENHYIFVLYSSIIDYHDKDNISFVSNFYFEYFVSCALITKNIKEISQFFFSRGKIKVPLIDILVLFLSCSRTKSKTRYDYIKKKMQKDNIVYILLCEFDNIPDNERYKYFISIFRLFKKNKKTIYYGRFHSSYGPLKNIDNMAQRMQQLLPDRYRFEAVNFLISEIKNYLQNPSQQNTLSFGNAIILLNQFIDGLWSDSEKNIIKSMALCLIQFFLYNNFSKELESLLSEHIIFDWYKVYNWTLGWKKNEWELFYKDISGLTCELLSEISSNNEFTIKFDIFSYFYNDGCIKPLWFPLLCYAVTNDMFNEEGMATFVPDFVTDDNGTPIVKSDDRIFTFSYILKNIELNLSEILDFLLYTMKNNLYRKLNNSYDNPIKILEEKLYRDILLLDDKEYNKFSEYYFNADEYGLSEELFKIKSHIELEKLKKFLVNEIIDKYIKKWRMDYFISKLIDFSCVEESLKYLYLIKEKMSENIYANIIYCIINNKEHILYTSKSVISEYNLLFAKKIYVQNERNKIMGLKKKKIEKSNKKDVSLILNNNEMVNELMKINNYLLNPGIFKKEKSGLRKLFSLRHKAILDLISYGDINEIPPVFSEYAIKILEDFYRDDTFDIDIIIENLRKGLFSEECFYIYFYWIFIAENQKKSNSIIINENTYPELTKKIISSLNDDASKRFINWSVEYFERVNIQWLTPFFYYYQTLLKNTPPEWMKVEHLLKLIVVTDPRKTGLVISTDVNLKWYEENFNGITSEQIIEYGLNIFDKLTNSFSRIQIVKYILEYYKSNTKGNLNDVIMDFILNTTKRLFNTNEFDHHFGEFQYIAFFWRECNINHVDRLFEKFTMEIVTSVIRKENKDTDYQYRKDVLLYCIRITDTVQKKRIINEIEGDISDKILTEIDNYEVHNFLASLGREESIKYIINLYLNGKEVRNRFDYYRYPLGCLTQNNNILNDYINLLLYGTEKSTERRSILLGIAQNGIKQHLNNINFKLFERRIVNEIRKFKKQSGWQSEFYEEYLLQMEQMIFP